MDFDDNCQQPPLLYSYVNFSPHRQSPVVVGAPGLSFCRAYRKPDREGFEWKGAVRQALEELAAGQSIKLTPVNESLGPPTYEVFRGISGEEGAPHYRVCVELHAEYLAISYHLDLSVEQSYQTDRSAAEELSRLIALLEHRERDFYTDSSIRDSISAETAYRSVLVEHSRRIFRDQWEQLASTLNKHEHTLGELFADFRLLILAATPVSAESCTSPNAAFFKRPLWRPSSVRPRDYEPPFLFSDAYASTSVATLWPILAGDEETWSSEFTASLFLDRQALYISTLGMQPERAYQTDDCFVRSVLLTSHPSRWEIGRLIERLHNLGVVRRAALFDVPALETASVVIKGTAQELEIAYRKLGEINFARLEAKRTEEPAPDSRDSAEQTLRVEAAREAIQRLFKKLADVDELFKVGGLTYRIERSRYYVKQFYQGVKELRLKRLESFQPYDEYVYRHTGTRFDFIDRIGFRYERLTSRIALAHSDVLAAELTTVAASTEDAERKIKQFQEAAEDIVFFMILPYYGSHVIEGLLAPIWHMLARVPWVVSWGSVLLPNIVESESARHGFYYCLCVVLAILLSWTIWRKRNPNLGLRGVIARLLSATADGRKQAKQSK